MRLSIRSWVTEWKGLPLPLLALKQSRTVQTAAMRTTEYGDHAIIATIDGRDKIITEASIRRHLKFQDSE
ncbi:hypothetical protein Tco_1494900, partial [Tanacetum coccineum]